MPAEVNAPVQPRLHRGHADRVGIEHAGGIWVVAYLGRVAGDEQEVANTAGGAAEQIRLHADQVAVAAAEMEDRLDLGLGQDARGGNQRRDARTRPGTVGDVDGIDAVFAEGSAFGDHAGEVVPAWRDEFDGGNPFAFDEFLCEP